MTTTLDRGQEPGSDEHRVPSRGRKPTPGWLLEREAGLCPCGCIGKRRKGSFVEKTVSGAAGILRAVMFSDEMARRGGLLQRIDPRVKLLGLMALLLGVAFVHRPVTLLVAYAGTVALALVSGLPLGVFLRRVWLFVPIFTGIVVLPATLSIVTPGDVVFTLWHWDGAPQGFTAQGLTTALLLVTRVATSVSLVLLVTLTTTWTRLLAALRGLGVPRFVVLVVGMAYRYLFVLLASVTEMYESRRARTLGVVRHDESARKFLTATAGALLGKANHLAEEVHFAMVSRGYRGEARTLAAPRITGSDLAYGVAALALAVLVVVADRSLG